MEIGKHLLFETLSDIGTRTTFCKRWTESSHGKWPYTWSFDRKYLKVYVRYSLFLLTFGTVFSFVVDNISTLIVATVRVVGALMASTTISAHVGCAMVWRCLKKTSPTFFEGELSSCSSWLSSCCCVSCCVVLVLAVRSLPFTTKCCTMCDRRT